MTAIVIAVLAALPAPQPLAAPELLIGVAYSAPASVPDVLLVSDMRAMRCAELMMRATTRLRR